MIAARDISSFPIPMTRDRQSEMCGPPFVELFVAVWVPNRMMRIKGM